MTRDGQSVSNIAEHVQNLFRKARSARRPLVNQWTKNYNVLRNVNVWNSREAHLPTPRIPEIYPIIATITAWQTDTYPTFEVTPAAIPNTEYFNQMQVLTDDLQQILQSVWSEEHYDAEIEKSLWDSNVYGIGVLKVTWDQTLQGGLGNPSLRRVDPYTWYPDPDATSMDDAQYFCEARVMSAQELEKRYPGALKKVGSEGWIEGDQAPTALRGTRPSQQRANPGAMPTSGSIADPVGTPSGTPGTRWGMPGGTDRPDVTDDRGYMVIQAWLRTPITTGDNKTDTWRMVCICGNTVLVDEPATNLWSHGQHPYVRFVPHDMGEFYGTSLVELLTPAQTSINRLLASIEQNIWLVGNPVFVSSMRAGISRAQVTNKPGQRLDVTSNVDDVKWMQPPQSNPQQATSLIDFYIGEMDRISGLSAIVRGITPTGRNAQGVLDSLQEAAFVRIRMNLRNLERALTVAGDLVASLITEFYDMPRYIPVLGKDGQRSVMALRSQHFYLPEGDTRVPLKFAMNIQAGSMLPTSKQARAQEAQSLYALGVIDEEAVLDTMDWPGRSRIVQRVRDMKAMSGTLGEPPTRRAAARH